MYSTSKVEYNAIQQVWHSLARDELLLSGRLGMEMQSQSPVCGLSLIDEVG